MSINRVVSFILCNIPAGAELSADSKNALLNHDELLPHYVVYYLSGSEPKIKVALIIYDDNTTAITVDSTEYHFPSKLAGEYAKLISAVAEIGKYIDLIAEAEVNKAGSLVQLQGKENKPPIGKPKTAEEAYKTARIVQDPVILKQLQQIVINSNGKNSPEWAYEFAYNIKGADVKALQQVVIKSGNPKWAYKFARDVKGADIKVLQQVVTDSTDKNTPEWAYWFAFSIKGADIKALQQAVIKSGKTDWIYAFTKDIIGLY